MSVKMTINYNFEWELRKAYDNLDKHGIKFDEAATVFRDSKHFSYLIQTTVKLKTDG